MEGNLCWNCGKLLECKTTSRPKCFCPLFEAVEYSATYEDIAMILKIKRNALIYQVHRYGALTIVKRLEDMGIKACFTHFNNRYKFYLTVEQCFFNGGRQNVSCI